MIDIPKFSNFSRIVFFTGAGMSAESGVPVFRGKGGIWKDYDYESYACQKAFDSDPKKVWDFHNYRRGIVAACKPNRGHEIVAECWRSRPNVKVITQNIDGLHQAAGCEEVVELHGGLWRIRCDHCKIKQEKRDSPLLDLHCDRCGNYWRPDIVWFGDMLDNKNINAAMKAIRSCQLLVSIGTSAVVYPAAQMPLEAKNAGALLVEINPEETPISNAFDLHLRGPASEMLARMLGLSLGRS